MSLHTPLRDAGPLKAKDGAQPIEATPATPAPPQLVVVAPVAIESLPTVNVATLPTPASWVHTIRRDANGQMVEVISTPMIEAAT